MNRPAKKRFGQHFLVDESVIDAIVTLIDPRPGEHLIEIGPGRAALTVPLTRRSDDLTVIEIDRDLAAELAVRFESQAMVRIVCGDVLKVDLGDVVEGKPWRMVGNLPYNISTPLILRLLEYGPAVRDMTFMLQKEVVERLTAAPGTRAYGRLSVMVQALAVVTGHFEVAPRSFSPPPKVISQLVHISPQTAAIADNVRQALERCTRHAFAQRRKTLRNSLGPHIPASLFAACEIDPMARAETIPVAKFIELAEHLATESAANLH